MTVTAAARIAAALAVLLTCAPRALTAQNEGELSPVWRPHQITLTALAGGAAYSDFITVDMVAGTDERLTARTSLAVAAALAYWPSRDWGVRIHAGWAPTRFERERGRTIELLDAEARGAPLAVWMADVDLLVRLPLGVGRVAPYGILGGGVVRYVAEEAGALPPEARTDFVEGVRDRAALVLGAGARVPLQRQGLLLAFELTDHVVRSPVEGPAGEGEGVTSNVRLLVGLTLPLAWSRTP